MDATKSDYTGDYGNLIFGLLAEPLMELLNKTMPWQSYWFPNLRAKAQRTAARRAIMTLLSRYASPCLFTAMQDRQTPQNDVSDAIPQRLPGDLHRFLSENFMKYQVREFITDKLRRLLIF